MQRSDLPSADPPRYAPTILGRSCDEMDLGWARIIHARHDPSLSLPYHEHRHSALTLVRSGGFRLAWRHEEQDCTKQNVFFKRGGERHANRFGPKGTRSFVIELREQDEGLVTGHGLALRLPSKSKVLGPNAVRLADDIEREWHSRDALTPLVLQGQLLLLLTGLARSEHAPAARDDAREPAWMRKVDEALRDTPATPPSLSTLAELAGVDPAYLTRTYRRHRGCTIGTTARNFRLDAALHRVRTTQDTIADIAVALGFYDQAHLTRAFKARFGVTPGRARHEG